MMHASHLIVGALEPSETTLGELLREPGDRIGYTYDLGDFFEHVITLEEVVDASASTGAVAVLGGAMRCPNEGGDGSPFWGGDRAWAYRVRKDDDGDFYCVPCDRDDFVKSLDPGWRPPDESRARAAALSRQRARSVDAMNVRPGAFDPAEFDLEACRARVRDAIGSKASAMEGAKQFTSGGARRPSRAPGARQRQVNGVEGGFALTETVSTRPDRREERVCATCGSRRT
ncbi:hypothetical protein JL720_1357 [Aureococcus anophagefferens]|nr:hypothetical protein JL720_1357 [Aureococcus anophagefferens]